MSLALTTPVSAAECTRAFLKEAADKYTAAIATAGAVATLSTLSENVDYSENDKKIAIKSGILASGIKCDNTRNTYDTTQCATFTELICPNNPKPYVVASQVRYTDGKITKIESIITTTGDWLFNAKDTLKYAQAEKWDEIPEAKRDTRAVIQHAGDAYADVFSNKSTVVPWGTPCARLEGGMYTGKNSPTDSCNVGVPSGVSLTKRRYVIDEVLGTVDLMMSFASLPDSHEFRVEGGKLRYVHTLTVMSGSTRSGGGAAGGAPRAGGAGGMMGGMTGTTFRA